MTCKRGSLTGCSRTRKGSNRNLARFQERSVFPPEARKSAFHGPPGSRVAPGQRAEALACSTLFPRAAANPETSHNQGLVRRGHFVRYFTNSKGFAAAQIYG